MLFAALNVLDGTVLDRIHAAIMPVLQIKDRATVLVHALAELGCIVRTLHMLGYIDSRENRHIVTQLNCQELRHRFARRVYLGSRRDREGLPGAGGAARHPSA